MTAPHKLSDICEFIVDCEHKTAPLADDGYPSIRTPNVGRGRLILDGVNLVSEETYHAWTRRAVPQPGDIIIAREAPVGNVAIVKQGQQVCLGQRTLLVRPSGDYVQHKFHSASIGCTVPHLNMADIRNLELPPLPSREVQQKIAGILSAYDDLIGVNQRRMAILEDIARRLFDEWFVRFRYPGHEAVPLVETELGPAPQGWQPGVFADCVDINPETLSPRNAPASINYIDISSVSVGQVDNFNAVAFADAPGRARRIVRDGDTIWSTVRPNRRSHALLLNIAKDTIASTGFAVIRAKGGNWAWVYEATRTEGFVGFLVGRARGSAYPAVVGNDFEEAPMLTPPEPIRAKFQKQASPFYEQAAVLQSQNARLRAARDLLLPKLISGEIDVSGAEADLAEAAE